MMTELLPLESDRRLRSWNDSLATDDWGQLLGLRNRGKTIGLWSRPPAPVLQEWLDELDFSELPDWVCDGTPDAVATQAHDHLSGHFNDHRAALLLAHDIAELTEVWAVISEAKNCHVRLESIDSDQCTRFHTDQVGIRLLHTYRGPGTWWVPAAAVNGNHLLNGGSNELIVAEPRAIQKVPSGTVALLKGDAFHPGIRGVVHRSPPIEMSGITRLLLRIDDLSGCGCGTC